MTSMSSLKNIHAASAILFFVMAAFYVAAGLMFRNGVYAAETLAFMRSADIPLALFGLTYGASSLIGQMSTDPEEPLSPWGIAIVAAAITLFGLVVFLDLAFPGRF